MPGDCLIEIEFRARPLSNIKRIRALAAKTSKSKSFVRLNESETDGIKKTRVKGTLQSASFKLEGI